MRLIPKEVEALWTLFTAPVVWAAHFLICYASVAVYCARAGQFGFGFSTIRIALALVTAAALLLIAMSAWLAWRQWGFGVHEPPHDAPTRGERTRFQGFATLLLSGLSFVAVLFVALPLLFIAECLR